MVIYFSGRRGVCAQFYFPFTVCGNWRPDLPHSTRYKLGWQLVARIYHIWRICRVLESMAFWFPQKASRDSNSKGVNFSNRRRCRLIFDIFPLIPLRSLSKEFLSDAHQPGSRHVPFLKYALMLSDLHYQASYRDDLLEILGKTTAKETSTSGRGRHSKTSLLKLSSVSSVVLRSHSSYKLDV